MKIKKTEFIKSSTSIKECPLKDLPEFVFYGRSNVGKSSLINMITNNQKLSKISSKPGKTQLINHFVINDSFYLADLPGYGYAKVSKKLREEFQKFTLNYLEKRTNLICLFLLIDLRVKPQKIDTEFMEYCATKEIPFTICFTKSDKLKKAEISTNLENYKTHLLKEWESFPNYFTTSSINKLGIDEILSFIEKYNLAFKSW